MPLRQILAGFSGRSCRSGRGIAASAIQSANPMRPRVRTMTSRLASKFSTSRSSTRVGMPCSTSSSETGPCCCSFSPRSTTSRMVSAVSRGFATATSMSRTTRNMWAVRMPTPGNSWPRFSRMTSSSIAIASNAVLARKRDEARQQVGNLHAREFRPPLVLDNDREILAAIRDERKRVSGVERQRRQHGTDIDVEDAGSGRRDRHPCSRRHRERGCARRRVAVAGCPARTARARRAWPWRLLARASLPGRGAP